MLMGHFKQDTKLCGEPRDVGFKLFDLTEEDMWDQGYNDELFAQRAVDWPPDNQSASANL